MSRIRNLIVSKYLPYVNTGQVAKRYDCDEWSERQQMNHQADPVPNIFRRQLVAFIVFSFALTSTACTPSPQKVVMPDPNNTAQGSKAKSPEQPAAVASQPGTATKPTSSGPSTDTAQEAIGRRTLSTAFVRIGPDGHLTVELLDGRVIVLRDVVMGPNDYCGMQVAGNSARTKYCGGYAEVAAARPGGGELPDSAVSNAGELTRGPIKGS